MYQAATDAVELCVARSIAIYNIADDAISLAEAAIARSWR
jgi:hypothetical protein